MRVILNTINWRWIVSHALSVVSSRLLQQFIRKVSDSRCRLHQVIMCLCLMEEWRWRFCLQAAQGGGHRTLLYGHAILLRHSFSGMVGELSFVIRSAWPSAGCVNVSCFVLQYLTCLKTSRSMTDKLSFDVGLQEDSTGEVWCSGWNCTVSLWIHSVSGLQWRSVFSRWGLLVDDPSCV